MLLLNLGGHGPYPFSGWPWPTGPLSEKGDTHALFGCCFSRSADPSQEVASVICDQQPGDHQEAKLAFDSKPHHFH